MNGAQYLTNNQGRNIRYANLQYEMAKLDSVKDMSVCLLSSLVSQYADLYEKMYEIDPIETAKNIQTFVTSLVEILNIQMRDWTYDDESLVGFYDNFIQSIIVPRFSAFYDTMRYSVTLQQRVFSMICESCRNSLSVKSLNDKLSLLQGIDQDDKDSLECVFNIIAQNFRESDTVDFRKTSAGQINKLIITFNDCIKKGVNLSRILRFLVINQLHSDITEPNAHYIKHLLYVQTGELTISNYMLKRVHTEFTWKPSFDAILRGIPENTVLTGLDQYYVNYEKTHWK